MYIISSEGWKIKNGNIFFQRKYKNFVKIKKWKLFQV